MKPHPIVLSLLLTAVLHAASDVTISTAVTSGGSFSGANPNVFTPVNAAAVVQASAIQTQLNAGTGVTIETASAAAGSGDITVSTAVTKSSGANTAPMVLNAVRDIAVGFNVTASAGQVPLTLNAGRKITLAGAITTNGGGVLFNPVEELLLGANVNAGAGAVTLQSGLLRGTISSPTITASSLSVASGASLKMPGTVAGALNVAGIISPAAPGVAGSLQVNGALALQAGSTTGIEIGGTSGGSWDKITSTGAVTIAGGLQVEFVNNFHDTITTANSFVIVQGSSISGTFTGLPNGSRYTLANDRGSFRITYTATTVTLDDWQPVTTPLAWDPGTAEAGTMVFSNTNTRGGRHLFKVTTQSSDIGGWRTRLTVTSGEAALYFSKTALPTTASSTFSSVQTGSDGLVLRDDQFGANEEWNLMVYATEGAQWSLVSGKPYVQDLGALPFIDSNGNGVYDIGEAVASQNAPSTPMPPEGIRFYKTVVPNGTPAWSLWLGGSTREIALRSNKLPFHNTTSNYTKKQAGRMLMVPPTLGVGSSTWYSSVVAPQGEEIGLDSRIQFVNDLAYNGTVLNVAVSGPLYRVYRVQVPVDQIAWDINVTAQAGNPDVAVRKGSVPGEFDNEAFSATPGNATEGITLVPNYLTDGTWYITSWSDAPYTFTLKNGDPVITPISFTDTKVNDQPSRSGWRFYALTDIPSQVGALGWELELSNQVAGTQLALRRNKVPSRWQKRTDGSVSDTNATYMDDSSTNGFIQRMNHQADVWYVGVFLPQQPLGAFTLDVHPITPATISFQSTTTVTAIPSQKWRYYRMDIGSGMLGWDVRLANLTGGLCTMVVRRDQLPQTTGTNNGASTPWSPSSDTSWGSGYQWEGGKDWSGRTYDVTTTPRRDMNDRIVAAAGRPLVPGTYYIGIRNDSSGASAQPSSMTLESRGIGDGLDIPVGTMGFSTGSSVSINNLAAREAAYYKVSIPDNTTSWEFTLDQSVGESAVVMRRGAIPDFNAVYNGDVQNVSNTASRQVKMQRTGSERYLMLPLNNEVAITPGDYYIGVFSEGLNPPNSDVIGSGPSSATLTSRGPLAVQNLGAASAAGIVQPVSLSGLQVKAYQFTVPVGTAALEVRMDNKVGNPLVAVISGMKIPQPDGVQDYGVTGGQTTGPVGGMNRDTLTNLSTYPNPVPGVYTLTVRADEVSGTFPDASADLVITANAPVPLAFNGTANVTSQPATAWRYFQVTVPDGIMAWDIRLTNITSGNPQMVIRRDQTPSSVGTNNGVSSPWSPSSDTSWSSGYQWAGGSDWTGRTHNLLGGSQRPIGNRVFAAMGRPLVAGTYIVGILNQGTDPVTGTGNTPANYSIESRGVGVGQPVTVGEIPFAAGSNVTVTDQPRREAAFFKITVPANTPRWEFNLSPTAGEAMMVVRRGYLPDFNAVETGSMQDNSSSREVKIQRAGMERYLLLPENNQDFIVAGDYYVAVVAEGVNPPASHVVGTGSSSAVFTIQPPMPVKDLGTVSTSGITQVVSLAAAEVKAFQFTVPVGTVSMEIGLENKVGNPVMAFISGTRIPQPDSSAQDYGVSSGQTAAPAGGGLSRQYGTGLLTFTSPPAGVYTATVRADDVANPASANFVIRANAPQDLPLGGGSTVVTNHGPNSWKYFRVDVPAGVAGWDLRVKDITGGDVSWAIRRDQIPAAIGTSNGVSTPWTPSASATWPSGYQWAADKDWTARNYDTTASAKREVNDRLVMAMGRPLEAGTYFIGILNGGSDPIGGGSNQMSSYTIESRFIGAGQAIPVGTLGFAAGSSAAVNNLVPREAAYYKVSIPDNVPSWEFTLAPSAGEMMVAARQGFIPDFNAAPGGNVQDPTSSRQVKVQKAGGERYLLLPPNNEDKIVAGDYYLAVVSEGVNPPNASTIGSGTSSGTLASNGSPAVTQLGTASLTPINRAVSLAGAQVKGYQFTVPEGVVSLELQLNNRTGNPRMALISGSRLPFPDTTVNEFATGGGQSSTPVGGVARVIADSLITVPNPPAGTYSLTVRADDLSSAYPDATGDLVIVARPRTALNFAASQNGNGLSNADTKQLADGQKQFYEVAVPATLSNQPVLGWILKVNHSSGDTTLKIYKTWGNPATGIQITGNTALIVPPFLTFNETWFVEVTATGLTNYTLTSQPVTLERPVWQMPLGHNFTFGDSGNDSAGNPLPGDRGVDIGQDDWHIYAIDVPQGNSGLLRTELRAINGNPDLYIREDGVPTTDHDANGGDLGGASLVNREMKDTGSEYGNWVPVDGRAERQLRPGRWYLGVKASGGSNARYRLLVSTGNVTDLDLTNASVNNQTLIGRDWRYYRFTVPVDAPAAWNLGFTQQVGDVVMWVRDTVPSGQNTGTSSANTSIESWVDDNKNQGPYLAGGYDAPQVYAFNTAPLRPGHTYYAGFRANSDATFSVTSTTTGSFPAAIPVSFYNGVIDTNLPAGGSALYKIAAPAEGTRLKWTATHPATVQIRVEQGTIPAFIGNQHSNSTTANSSLNQALTPTGWPWQSAQTYYVRIVNNGASPASVLVNVAGVNAGTEDEDADGLPDVWERQYFNSLTHNGAADPDGDGVANSVEFTDGTNPNDINSAKYFLTVNANFGTVVKSPDLPKYDRGTNVTLTATPNVGLIFTGWSVGATGTVNPLPFAITANKNITANFGVSLPVALDSPLTFTTGGDGLWMGQKVTSLDGEDAAQSAPIGHSQQAWMETTVSGPGEMAFAWKVSSQGGDYLEFYVDGVLRAGRITGEVDWQIKSYAIDPGQHVVRWRYVKNGSGTAGSDAAWVDGVNWIPAGGYNQWVSDHFTEQEIGDPAIVGQDADPDGDGMVNVIEYAFGSEPREGDPDLDLARVTPEVVEIGGKKRLRLRFTLPEFIPADVLYEVEVTNDLGGWTVIADQSGVPGWNGAASSSIGDPVNGRCEHIITDDATLAPTTRRFGRVKVTIP
ncbi:InlB B-repeat-containing protein [Luteolibacter soli]|uniref:Bacterial repeat domain-containing protein n=1 Tax=Luteolibacter soli TaxID=3135280 RepID=A0ABU9AU69_9BACT